MPHRCRAGAASVPRGCSVGAARVPRRCRVGAAAVPRQCCAYHPGGSSAGWYAGCVSHVRPLKESADRGNHRPPIQLESDPTATSEVTPHVAPQLIQECHTSPELGPQVTQATQKSPTRGPKVTPATRGISQPTKGASQPTSGVSQPTRGISRPTTGVFQPPLPGFPDRFAAPTGPS